MTQQKHLKRRIRERQQKTGESYTTARSHLLAQLKKTKALQLQDTSDSSPDLRVAKALPTAPATVEVPTPMAPATSLMAWVERHRLEEEPLQQLEQLAFRVVQGVTHIDTSKLAACAKAVLISEMIDRVPRRRKSYPKMLCDALRVIDDDGELEIFPSDYTPVSEDLLRHALEVAAIFSDGEDCEILNYWSVGHLSGATPRGRKAAVRFMRLMGARVLVSVYTQPISNGKHAELCTQLDSSGLPEPVAQKDAEPGRDSIQPQDLHRFIGQPVRVVFVDPDGGFADTAQGVAAVWHEGTTEPSTLLAFDRKSVTVRLPSQRIVHFENPVAVRAC